VAAQVGEPAAAVVEVGAVVDVVEEAAGAADKADEGKQFSVISCQWTVKRRFQVSVFRFQL
jgi:hypothetical protein